MKKPRNCQPVTHQKNTKKTNKWAIDNYAEWRKWRNENRPQGPASSCIELLSSGDARFFNKWLSRYVVETRGEKGLVYPSTTIHILLGGCSAICYHSTLLLPGFLIRRTTHHFYLVNPRRSEGYSTSFVCVSVCVSVCYN